MAEKSFGRAEQIRATHARLDERLPGSVPERPGVCACVRRLPAARPIRPRFSPLQRPSPPTWRYRLRRALSLHTGCARNNFPDSLFSLISCEIQYPKFSATGGSENETSHSARSPLPLSLPLSSLLPFVRNLVRFKIAPRPGRDAKRERYRCFPDGTAE